VHQVVQKEGLHHDLQEGHQDYALHLVREKLPAGGLGSNQYCSDEGLVGIVLDVVFLSLASRYVLARVHVARGLLVAVMSVASAPRARDLGRSPAGREVGDSWLRWCIEDQTNTRDYIFE